MASNVDAAYSASLPWVACDGPRDCDGQGMTAALYGWDIGGAHLKLACLNAKGRVLSVRQVACPLWQGIEQLELALHTIGIATVAPAATHGVTMTGELCDVFDDRASGVRAILECLTRTLDPRATVCVYGAEQGWLDAAQASAASDVVASANWLATAQLTALRVEAGVLLDIGSTSTDVILIEDWQTRAVGRDDATRLTSGELVYTGVVRTPVMAVARRVPMRGAWQSLAAEYFATMADVYRVLGQLDERHDQMPTADGRPKDSVASARRIARMLGRDLGADASFADIQGVAAHLARCQQRDIEDALALQSSRAGDSGGALPIIGAGAGAMLAAKIAAQAGRDYVPFASLLDVAPSLAGDVALAAPAVAVARLAWMAR